MRKRIHLFSILFLVIVCLGGCGRQGKVSNKVFEQALDVYQEYYSDLCKDTDECYIQLSLDADGLPFIMTAEIEESSYSSEKRIEMQISTIMKGEVVSLLDESCSFREFNTDYVVYSDGIVGILDEDEREWYQVRGGELNKVANYDVNAEIVTFYLGKEDIDIDVTEEDSLIYEKEYERICKMLYGQIGPGTAYGKQVWLQQLMRIERVEQPAFLQSLPVGWQADMFDSSDFRRMVSKLKQTGSMNNEEFLIWHYNYVVDNGWDDVGDFPSASSFVFRDPTMLNEITEYMTYDKEWSQIYLLSYLDNTRDWNTAEKIGLFEELGEEELESWQALWLLSRMEYILLDETHLYDVFLDDSEAYVVEYEENGAIDPSDRFDSLLDRLSRTFQIDEKPTEDMLFMRHAIKKLQEEYDKQTDGKEGVEYLRTSVELADNLPKLLETWGEGYIGSEQMERDYAEYIKDQYVAFISDGNDYVSQCGGYEYADIGYVFVKMGDREMPSLLRLYQFPPNPELYRYQYDCNVIDILIYSDSQMSEYSFQGKVYWIDENKSIYIDEYWTRAIYSYLLWTLKDGVGYITDGKEEDDYSHAEVQYFLLEGKSGDAYGSGDNISYIPVSEQEYNEAMSKYVNMTKYPRMTGPKCLYCDHEPGQIFGKTYPTIEEALEAYLQNPDGGIEVIEFTDGSSSQEKAETQNEETGNSQQTGETSNIDAEAENAENPILDIVVEDEVTRIRAWYNETQNNLDSYVSFSASDSDITCYKDTELSRLDAGKGFDGWNYTRRYYFRNGSLYFAFIFNGNEEHRLYFKEDQLIRYIDENKNTYDYGDTDRFSEWSVPVLKEAYQLYDEYF